MTTCVRFYISLTEEFESVEKTSSVDLQAKDSNGWTVMHHLVSPLEYGTYDNEEIFYVLSKVGAPLNVENSKGETPLKMALRNGALKLTKRLQDKLGEDPEKAVSRTTFESVLLFVCKKKTIVEGI